MTTTHTRELQREQARENLRAILPPGAVITTITDHVARSGGSRVVRVLVADHRSASTPEHNAPIRDISGWVAQAIGRRHVNDGRRFGIFTRGDARELVGDLADALYPAAWPPAAGRYALRHVAM